MYPENNGEVLPKLRLGRERNMGANLVCASSGYPNNVDNPKRIRLYICEERILPTVSVSDGRRLTG